MPFWREPLHEYREDQKETMTILTKETNNNNKVTILTAIKMPCNRRIQSLKRKGQASDGDTVVLVTRLDETIMNDRNEKDECSLRSE